MFHQFRLDRVALQEETVGAKISNVYRLLRHDQDTSISEVSPEGIEDPTVGDFLFLLKRSDQLRLDVRGCLVLYSDSPGVPHHLRGGYFIATWLTNLDSGYFYCPYVPLTQTPVVLDPKSFSPLKGILSKYGMKILTKHYGKIAVANNGGP